ncbi:unnamed protein product [Somion occarium]|uniref:Cytochrome P450 n=1 Tax=Somion occarium TaxID=3059160 RepID=A0ABP1D3A7_9APHY
MELQIAVATILFLLCVYIYSRRPKRNLPPGPPPVPLIGNILQLPKEEAWFQFTEWGRIYGDVITLFILNKPFLVLNSAQSIIDLFDNRSAIYSSRPHLVMADELMGFGDALVFAPYGERFKNMRKLLKVGLGPTASRAFWPLIEKEIGLSLSRLLDNPDDFAQNFRQTAGATALKTAYGFQDEEEFRMLTKDTEDMMYMFSLAARPDAFLVDTLPFLKYVPSWFPGAGFQKLALKSKAAIRQVVDSPFESVKRKMASGTAPPSYTATLLGAGPEERIDDLDIKWTAAGVYAGQADTTVTALSNFYLCMIIFPEIQEKAQAEVDRVVGPNRLPSIKDRESLPYVCAILKEVLRWRPVARIVTHSVIQDDTYRGYFIPSGSAVVANVWAACHDESVYKDPAEFRPERFLPPESAPDSSKFAFGFGRRACPGEAVAQASLFCTMACTFATLKLSKAKDENGNVIEPVLRWTSGVTSFPHPFKCDIKPRSAKAVELIRNHAARIGTAG